MIGVDFEPFRPTAFLSFPPLDLISKILTTVLSSFTAAYIHLWSEYFPESPLSINNLPTFDGRIIQYATYQELQDYFKWRQVDAHINNLYNTTFWALVKRGNRTSQEAHGDLKGTFSKDKHSILFDRFQINYNNEPEIFKKGSILIWRSPHLDSTLDKTRTCQDSVDTQVLEKPSDQSSLSSPAPSLPASDSRRCEESVQSNLFDRNHSNSVSLVHEDLIKDSWWIDGSMTKVAE